MYHAIFCTENEQHTSLLDSILNNQDDNKKLSKVAYKKHQNKHTNYKYDPDSAAQK